MPIQRIVRIVNSHQQADAADVQQQVAMSADERRAIVRELQRRVYGATLPPIRARRRRGK
jgi:hypothetical protein